MRSLSLLGLALALAVTAAAMPPPEPSILFDASYGARLNKASDPVALWWASSGWKVAKTRPVPRKSAKSIELALAQNEREAAQLIVCPSRALTGFTAAANALTGPNGAQLAAKNIEVLRVRYVNVERITDNWGAAAPWPDPLPPFSGPIALAANENQPLWIRVFAPKGTPTGEYTGAITLRAEGYAAEVPLKVRVYGFALPDRMTCSTAFGFSTGNVCEYQKLETDAQRKEVLEKYLFSLGAHHITPYGPSFHADYSAKWVTLTPEQCAGEPKADRALLQAQPLTPVFDWTAWDTEMQRVFDTYHFTSFRLGLPGIGGGDFQGFKDGTRERDLAFARYAKAVQEHLREKGWLDEAYVYWIDEPTEKEYPHVLAGFDRLKNAAPDIRRMLTEQVEPGLNGGPNLWCPMTSAYKHEKTLPFRAQGDHFWWYVCTVPKRPFPGLFIDHPGIDLRVWLWQTWKYDVEGILIWQSNLWTTDTAYPDKPQNPYEDPMSWMTGYGTKKGDKKPWGNGDGRFMYPPEAAADANPPAPVLEGPVDSIRWEMLRDGIEDYEYLAMLKRSLDAKGDTISKRARAKYEKLLEVPEDIAADTKTYTKDPAPIEKRREAIAKALEQLGQ